MSSFSCSLWRLVSTNSYAFSVHRHTHIHTHTRARAQNPKKRNLRPLRFVGLFWLAVGVCVFVLLLLLSTSSSSLLGAYKVNTSISTFSVSSTWRHSPSARSTTFESDVWRVLDIFSKSNVSIKDTFSIRKTVWIVYFYLLFFSLVCLMYIFISVFLLQGLWCWHCNKKTNYYYYYYHYHHHHIITPSSPTLVNNIYIYII
jgi:ABC-type Fe3+ transport system permease subunit